MNARQPMAYAAPSGDESLPGAEHHDHGEVCAGVPVAVVLTAERVGLGLS